MSKNLMPKKLWITLLGLLAGMGLATGANAETVVEKAARTGTITMGGRVDIIPFSYINDQKELVGYSLDIGNLVEQEVSEYLGKPVTVKYQQVDDFTELLPKVRSGEIDLACNTQFTWQREMFVDFSISYGLSGIRLLTKTGGLKGDPDSLVGKRVAVLSNTLGVAIIKNLQPKAILVPVSGIDAGIDALVAGKVDAVAGDSAILAGNIQRVSSTGYELVPAVPYSRYAVGCMVSENNSTFRNLVNLAIAKMLQGYVAGEPKYTAIVDKWLGPKGILELPSELIKDYFQLVLLTHEQVPSTDKSLSSK
jgi:polar amino acid transport system substrate-binding protein